MADIVNLRRARKTKARETAADTAAANRAASGRMKAERDASRAQVTQRERALDGKKRDS